MRLKLEKKYHQQDIAETDGQIAGYASLFGVRDQQGDVVSKGAFLQSLKNKKISDVKMLWQHDPQTPIGVWEEVYEDAQGLYVRGSILQDVAAGREALVLLRAGAVNGLSIGYRTLRSGKSNQTERVLKQVDLWEVSLVTFPMLPEARVDFVKETDCDVDDFYHACASLRQAILEEENG